MMRNWGCSVSTSSSGFAGWTGSKNGPEPHRREKTAMGGFGLPAALVIVGGIGWFGIFSRHYCSAPRFIEPWEKIADTAADRIRNGAMVIADNPSLFFYLSNILQLPDGTIPWKSGRLLPYEAQHPQVRSADEWLTSGQPLEPRCGFAE